MWGLTDSPYGNKGRVAIPYRDQSGTTVATRYRLSLCGDPRFKWRSGDKACLYGLWKFNAEDAVILVEGESDCHTLWQHGYNAVGVPGANNWKDGRDAGYFEKAPRVFVVIEPDRGGETVRAWLGKSKIRDKAHLIDLHDDVSALYLDDRRAFKERFNKALSEARPWTVLDPEEWTQAERLSRNLSQRPDILDEFYKAISGAGLVGEEHTVKLLYLMLTSRLLTNPISGVVKGVSACGKNYCVERVLKFLPESAYTDITSMSEHALFYWDEDIKHKFIILFEASGLSKSDIALTAIRTLLTEGKLKYFTVDKDESGVLRARKLEKEGPTGLLTTTTRNLLDHELETRLLTLNTEDSTAQTTAIILAQAEGQNRAEPDYKKWQALQKWLDGANRTVVIPFARTLAELIPPTDVRIRRDFPAVLNLIRASAILHQKTRGRDEAGRIVASLQDYEIIYPLVADSMARSVGVSVSSNVRKFVEAVQSLYKDNPMRPPVTIKEAAKVCDLSNSCARRYKVQACEMGYLVDDSNQPGRPSLLKLGELLPPEKGSVLPEPVQLFRVCKGGSNTHTFRQFEANFHGSDEWQLEMTTADNEADAYAELQERYGPNLVAIREVNRQKA